MATHYVGHYAIALPRHCTQSGSIFLVRGDSPACVAASAAPVKIAVAVCTTQQAGETPLPQIFRPL